MQEDDAVRWWASMRQGWGYTRVTDEADRCDRCGQLVPSDVVRLLAHRDWHLAMQRHPSAQ